MEWCGVVPRQIGVRGEHLSRSNRVSALDHRRGDGLLGRVYLNRDLLKKG